MAFVKKNAKHTVTESKLEDEETVYRDEYKYMVKQSALHQEEYNKVMQNMNSTEDGNATIPELETLKQLIDDEENEKEGHNEYAEQEEEEEEAPEEEEHTKKDL
jgi:hypothetical protein